MSMIMSTVFRVDFHLRTFTGILCAPRLHLVRTPGSVRRVAKFAKTRKFVTEAPEAN